LAIFGSSGSRPSGRPSNTGWVLVAETLRVRLSFATSDLVFLTPAGRPLGLKVGFECVAAEMEAIAREALDGTARV